MKAQRSMVNVSTGVDGEWQCGVAIVDGGRQRGDRKAALFSTGVVSNITQRSRTETTRKRAGNH